MVGLWIITITVTNFTISELNQDEFSSKLENAYFQISKLTTHKFNNLDETDQLLEKQKWP